MKYDLDQPIYYMRDNKIASAKILTRTLVENIRDTVATKAQENLYQVYGPSDVTYVTVHGQFKEDQVFGSKEELLASL